MKVKVAQSCLTLCNPIDYKVHGILQARILQWVAFPFSRLSSQPRDWTQVSCIAGGFFTSWATREAQEHWRVAYPSPLDLPNPGIEPGSPALQVDSLLTELWKKPINGVQFSSVAQLCLTLRDHMGYSTQVLPVYHQLLEFTQTHVHWVGDAI